jgi:hypothetical protein
VSYAHIRGITADPSNRVAAGLDYTKNINFGQLITDVELTALVQYVRIIEATDKNSFLGQVGLRKGNVGVYGRIDWTQRDTTPGNVQGALTATVGVSYSYTLWKDIQAVPSVELYARDEKGKNAELGLLTALTLKKAPTALQRMHGRTE